MVKQLKSTIISSKWYTYAYMDIKLPANSKWRQKDEAEKNACKTNSGTYTYIQSHKLDGHKNSARREARPRQ